MKKNGLKSIEAAVQQLLAAVAGAIDQTALPAPATGTTPLRVGFDWPASPTLFERTARGERLRMARELRGYCVSHLDRMVGHSLGTTNRVEVGGQSRIKGILLRYAEILHVRPDWLIYGTGPMELEDEATPTEMTAEVQDCDGRTLALAPVEVCGEELEAGRVGDDVWVSVRRVCDVLGLDPDSQRKKLKKKAWAVTVLNTVTASDGKNYQNCCLHLRSLPMWLATIEPSRSTAPELAEKLRRFQLEAADVLADHFLGPRCRSEEKRRAALPPAAVEGLATPAAPTAFAAEVLKIDDSGQIRRSMLWNIYEQWAQMKGLEPVSRQEFCQAMRKMGARKCTFGSDRLWLRIKLNNGQL